MRTPNLALKVLRGDQRQVDFAERILLRGRPISQGYYSQLETGSVCVTRDVALAIRDCLGAEMDAAGLTIENLLRGTTEDAA